MIFSVVYPEPNTKVSEASFFWMNIRIICLLGLLSPTPQSLLSSNFGSKPTFHSEQDETSCNGADLQCFRNVLVYPCHKAAFEKKIRSFDALDDYRSPTSFPNRDKETEFQAATDCKICPFDCLNFTSCICILLFLCFMTRNPNFGAIQLEKKMRAAASFTKHSENLSQQSIYSHMSSAYSQYSPFYKRSAQKGQSKTKQLIAELLAQPIHS